MDEKDRLLLMWRVGVPLLLLVAFIALLVAFTALRLWGGCSQVAPRDSAGTSPLEREKITLVGAMAFFGSFIGAFYLAFQAGACLFLVYLYGFSRVWREGLHFVAMPKGRPWAVSNGDMITEEHFMHFLFTIPLLVVLFIVLFTAAVRLSPWPIIAERDGRTRRST